jgi:gliding motility-associated-like protein
LGQFAITINLPPVVELEPVYIICNDEPTTVTVNMLPGETVRWSTGEMTQSIDIVNEGDYSVVVTSQEGCPSPARTFRTRKSEAPEIESIITTNFDRPNSVTINVTGSGEYLYFIDNSEPTRNNVFRNVSTGFHEVGAIDQYGCGQIVEEVLVIDYPRFFTPNADSFNDTWQVDDIDQFESAVFYIYDRTGKLLKQFNGASEGWDGFFNGQPLPSSDYWFTLEITDQGREFEVRGHFSMKR